MATKKKRPKSLYKKMWETRRRLSSTTMVGADPNANAARQAQPDAIAMTLNMHRTEQVCCFLGDMSAMRRTGAMVGHFPIMLSRSQAEAIEEVLTELGYSPFGRANRAIGESPDTNAA